MSAVMGSQAPTSAPRWGRLRSLVDQYVMFVYTGLAVIYLLLPVAVIILFSFNKPVGKSNFVWNQFSFDAWLHPFAIPGLANSLLI
jgi:spermidine/putrescine transport system permease protein